jgi:hypothetical protein
MLSDNMLLIFYNVLLFLEKVTHRIKKETLHVTMDYLRDIIINEITYISVN